MMIDITRLRASDFDAVTSDGAWRAGVNLWLTSWHSVPAGSMPDTDSVLAKGAGLGRDLVTWAEVKTEALRGWVRCSDGRLYHPTVCEIALESWIEKLHQRRSSGKGNSARWGAAFDENSVDAQIDAAAQMLSAIAPKSKSLSKLIRRQSRKEGK
ncbi:hypothetical protein [Sphingomonas sp. ACRSK]|uniref:hypothetical protein n=1 Tax=Sphingomonas sp. ACRSK TaxID=2918213 RepID=UPI001EF45895|nr:hypothetical protein [Sphingomonas sp. ACRSK]MCG7348942.1 hypothetical protein [Sphingomonas sp. ACRSK]